MNQNEGKKRNSSALDQGFKEIMKDAYILSNLLIGWVDEFQDCTVDDVRRCLPTGPNGRRIIDMNTEYSSSRNGPVFMDKVFRVDIKEKNVKLIIGIEGQGNPNPGYHIENRAMYYVSRMISDQKGAVFDKDDYDGIEKVYSIWCILNPPKGKENTIIRYSLKGRYDKEYVAVSPIYGCDLAEIIIVNISAEYEARTPMGLLSTLFGRKVDAGELRRRLVKDYKIPEDESLLRSVNMMSKTLDEEVFDYHFDRGFQEGKDQGYQEGKVDLAVECVRSLMGEMNITADKAMDILRVPDDLREEVLSRL
ncbi:MAG: hypothetical protein E7Z64_03360 [Thermoplasmata archaeon]|nr:hypothetical protein [Thermoplasmata archaeon]